ncbi:MAG TPA: COG1361 S-layer family protein [archaeon]|nr:COG1361 S-layer family protein [archaeon]
MNKRIISIMIGMSLLLIVGLFISPVSAATNLDTASLRVNLLNQDPDPAEPGKYVEIRLKAEKFGNNPLTNVNFYLETEYPFSFDGSDTPDKNIGRINYISGEDWYYTLKYKLLVDSKALEGTYTLKLKYKINNSQIQGVTEFDISVSDAKYPDFVAGNIISSPTKLVADTDAAQLNVEISNIGDKDAQNVVAKLNLPKEISATYSYSDRANLGTIGEGSSKTATYYLDIDKIAETKNYIVPLVISYKEADDKENEYQTKTINLEIPIKEKPKFQILSITTQPEKIIPGSVVKLKIDLKNIGKDADSVSLKIYKESSQPFTFNEKTDYIGNLDKDQEGNAIISFDVDKDAEAKKYILDLEIRAIDGEQVIVQNESLTIEVGKKESTNVVLYTIVGIIVFLVAGAYIYYQNKKEKKDKKKK